MKAFKKKLLAWLLVLIMVIGCVNNNFGVTYAEDRGLLNAFVTSVTIYDKNNSAIVGNDIVLGGTDNFTIRYDFALPNTQDYKAGDTLTTSIPTEYCKFTDPNTVHELKDDTGKHIANFTVAENGTVVITFTENIVDSSNVKGYFYVGCKLNAENVESNTQIEIDLDCAGADPITITVDNTTPPETNASISKNAAYYPAEFGWSIVLNPGQDETQGMIIKDTLSGQVLDKDFNVTFGGQVMTEGVDYTFNSDTGEFVFTVPTNVTGNTELIIPTKLKNEVLNNEDSSTKLSNTATLQRNDNTTVNSNTAERWYDTNWISKDASYDETNKTITWTIVVNNNKQDVTNAVVADEFLINNTDFRLVDVKLNGSTYYKDAATETKYSDTENPFPIRLGDITDKQIITFTVKKVDSNGNTLVPVGDYNNTATFTGDDVPITATASKTFTKTAVYVGKSGQYDAGNGQIKWTITVNQDRATIDNPALSDVFPQGLDYVPGSLKVMQNDTTDVTTTVIGDASFIGDDTKISYNFDSLKVAEKITDKYVFTFYTSIDSNEVTLTDNAQTSFTNTAEVNGTDVDADSSATVYFTPSNFKKLCNQWYSQNSYGGDYDGDAYDPESHQIKWKLSVNESMITMSQPTIVDKLDESQEFRDGIEEVKVYKHNSSGTSQIDDISSVLDYSYDSASHSITFAFESDITERYSIIYETHIKDEYMPKSGEQLNYSNSATITSGNYTATQSATSPMVSGYGLTKEGYLVNDTSSSEGAIIRWEIDVNKSKVTIPAGVITDTLQKGTVLLTDGEYAPTLQELYVGTNSLSLVNGTKESLTAGSGFNNYSYNELTRTFTYNLPKDTNKAYRLTIYTQVTDKSLDSVSNQAELSGYSPDLSNTDTVEGIQSQLAGGGIVNDQGTLTVIKVDKDDNTKFLQGAVFELYMKVDGQWVYQGDLNPTNSNGMTTYDMVRVDVDYYIKEKVAPEGYELSSEEYEFNIASDAEEKIITYEYANSKKSTTGTVSVTKYDSTTSQIKLEGAKFALYQVDNGNETFVAEGTTNASGYVEFDTVEVGKTYVIREIQAPAGYLIGSPAFEEQFEVTDANKSFEYRAYNTKKSGTITVKKTDDNASEEDRIPLGGAEFTLYTASTATGSLQYVEYDKKLTDEDGKIVFTELPYGTYYLKETAAPTGYEISDSSYKQITVSSNDTSTYTYTYTNKPIEGSIKFLKTDNSGTALQGAEFGLYDSTGNTLIATAKSGADGYVLFEELPVGVYVIKEEKAPAGYNISNKVVRVEISESKVYSEWSYNFTNAKQNASISFTKVDAGTNQPLSGATFTLYDAMGNGIDSITTSADGVVLFEQLPYGDYSIKETKAPDGYYGTNKTIQVSLTMDGVVYVNEDGVVANSSEAIIKNYSVSIPYIALRVKKADGNNQPLAGAIIGLYKEYDGTEVLITSAVSDNAGYAYFESVRIDDDNVGTTYFIKEIEAPTGYILSDATITVGKKYAVGDTPAAGEPENINKYARDDNNDKNDTYENTLVVNEDDSLKNNIVKGAILIKKLDESNTPLTGAQFTIYSDEACTTLVTTLGTNGVVTIADETGLLLNDVPFGTYYIKETQAPTGYYLNDDVFKVDIVKQYDPSDSTTVVNLQVVDEIIEGSIRITKRDASSNKALAGAKFVLCAADGTYDVNNPITAVTDANGVATFTGLSVNDEYYFKEIEAPKGYKVDALTIHHVASTSFVESNGYIYDETVKNTKLLCNVTINKTDDFTPANKLADAEFTLYKKDGTFVEAKRTDSNGVVTFTGLEYGDYYIQETNAPIGYVIDSTKHNITTAEFDAANLNSSQAVFEKTINSVNKKMQGQIKIVKRSGEDSTPLSGATFALYKASNGTLVDTKITGVDGIIIFNVEEYGEYYIRETKAPEGHVKSDILYSVNVDSTSTVVTKTIYNDIIKGDVIVYKEDESGNRLPGATFAIYNNDKTKVLETAVTDVDGTATFKALSYGTYWVKETVSPEGYVLNDEWKSVVIDGNYNEYYVTVVNKKDSTVSFVDIKLVKCDDVDNSIFVPGAEYTLYKDGVEYKKLTTDGSGEILFEDIPQDTGYTIVETKSPFGYYQDANPIVVDLDDASKIVNGVYTVETTDAPIPFYIGKQDADTGKALSGAKLSVDVNGQKKNWTSTQKNEEFYIRDFQVDKVYTLSEIEAPFGYKLATDIRFKINSAGKVMVEEDGAFKLIDDNTIIMKDTPEYIYISKLDVAVLKELPGAKLIITDSKKETVDSWTSTNAPHQMAMHSFVSGEEYTLTEITAPFGYEIAESIVFKLDETGTIYIKGSDGQFYKNTHKSADTIEMRDELEYIYISRIDRDTKDDVPGSELKVVDYTGTTVGYWTTTTDRYEVWIQVFEPNKEYTVIEEVTADGYKTAESRVFKVTEAGEVFIKENGEFKEVTDKWVVITDIPDSTSDIIPPNTPTDTPVSTPTDTPTDTPKDTPSDTTATTGDAAPVEEVFILMVMSIMGIVIFGRKRRVE